MDYSYPKLEVVAVLKEVGPSFPPLFECRVGSQVKVGLDGVATAVRLTVHFARSNSGFGDVVWEGNWFSIPDGEINSAEMCADRRKAVEIGQAFLNEQTRSRIAA